MTKLKESHEDLKKDLELLKETSFYNLYIDSIKQIDELERANKGFKVENRKLRYIVDLAKEASILRKEMKTRTLNITTRTHCGMSEASKNLNEWCNHE